MCLAALAIWLTNPFAAALIVPALHLWMWVVDPEVRLRPVVAAVMLLIGLAPPVLVVVYYAHALGLGPVGVLWNGLLLLAGGHIAVLRALEWSVLLGCVASVLVIAVRGAREPRARADADHRPRADHLRRPGIARRHRVRAAGPPMMTARDPRHLLGPDHLRAAARARRRRDARSGRSR